VAAPHPTPILVERRFPLDLSQSIGSIRDLYETGKRTRWDPERDIPWDEFDRDRYSAAVLQGARAVWSRRAWIEYTGLAETPALLIRFCLEAGREADPKYFLTVRNTEEAWHVEVFHRFAEVAGGYLERPANRAWEGVINQTLYRRALDAGESLDAYVAAHCAVEDGLELELYEAYAANARDPVARALLERVVADKQRHAAFGWLYLESRAPQLAVDARRTIEQAVRAWLEHVAFAGYHVPSLAVDIDASAEVAAARSVAEAGLGAVTPEAEEALFKSYLERVRKRLGELGIPLPALAHPRLGAL
jgi:hypothetical protein